MTATRADVARVVGASPSTVTYVLSEQRSTSLGTRERVMWVVREFDYHPNIVARSLASPVLHAARVLFQRQYSTTDVNGLDYIDGVRRASTFSGIQVVVPAMTSLTPLTELRSLMRSGALGGVVLMDMADGNEHGAMLLGEKVPTVLIGFSDRASGASGIDADFVQMARADVEYLSELGHHRIIALMQGIVSDDAHACQDQTHELLRATQELRVKALVRRVPEVVLTGIGIVGADDLIEECSAALSNNPAAVVGLICAAQTHGLYAPTDLSVLTLGITQGSGRHGETFSEPNVDQESMGIEVGLLLLRYFGGEPDPAQHRGFIPVVLTGHGTTTLCRS